MERIVIRYRLRPAEVERNLELVRGVYAEREATGPGDFRYATLGLGDGVSFVVVAVAPALPGPLPGLAAFRAYRERMEDRCEERFADAATLVGSYRMLGQRP